MKRVWLPPLTAHMLSWAAFLGVVFWPFGFSLQNRNVASGRKYGGWYSATNPGPFMRYLDAGVITLLLIPAVLTGLAVWLAWRRSTQSGHAKLGNVGVGSPLPRLLFCPHLVRRRIGDRFHWGVLFARSSGIDDLSDYCQHDQTGPGRRIGMIFVSKTKSLALHGAVSPIAVASCPTTIVAMPPESRMHIKGGSQSIRYT